RIILASCNSLETVLTTSASVMNLHPSFLVMCSCSIALRTDQ
ncbi:hypothetical protein L195_g063000, partial [Trifolium pratense]